MVIILIDLQRINNILRFQKEFKWVEKSPFYKDHKYYNNSLEAHAHKHPIKEKHTGKWNSLIKYDNYKTIIDSYNKASIDLSKKFDYISKGKYDLQYSYKHDSVNIVDLNNGLIVCLKYKDYSNCYNIATCYFPSKVDKLFSLRSYISDQNTISDINYIMLDNNNHNLDLFKEAMEEYFGINSKEHQILFNNENADINELIIGIEKDILEYLNFMEKCIQSEKDKKYYFVFNDAIEYVIKLSLLYKVKNNNYHDFYKRFLDIDINDSYKDALDMCKKYIDEMEKNNGGNDQL